MRSGSISASSPPAESKDVPKSSCVPSGFIPPTPYGSTKPSLPIVPSRREAEPLPSESSLTSIPVGMSYQISHLGRLPSDDVIRPSTLQGTNTPIEVSHDLVLEMKFDVPGKDSEVLRVSRRVTISSCCCMIESLLVPTYAEVDSGSPPSPTLSISPTHASLPVSSSRPLPTPWRDDCICERPTDWLIATQEVLGGGRTQLRGDSGLSPLNVRRKAEYRTVTEI